MKLAKLNAFGTHLVGWEVSSQSQAQLTAIFLLICRTGWHSDCESARMFVCLSIPNTPMGKDLMNVAQNVAETANKCEKHHQKQWAHILSSSFTW